MLFAFGLELPSWRKKIYIFARNPMISTIGNVQFVFEKAASICIFLAVDRVLNWVIRSIVILIEFQIECQIEFHFLRKNLAWWLHTPDCHCPWRGGTPYLRTRPEWRHSETCTFGVLRDPQWRLPHMTVCRVRWKVSSSSPTPSHRWLFEMTRTLDSTPSSRPFLRPGLVFN